MKYLKDKKVKACIKGKESHQAYSFLIRIEKIMDNVELAMKWNKTANEAVKDKEATSVLVKRDALMKANAKKSKEETQEATRRWC